METYRGIVAEQERYAQAIADAGVRVTVDPRRIEVPSCLVMVERAESTATLACNGIFDTSWVIHVLGGADAGIDTLRQLSAMVAQILAGMEIAPVTIEPGNYRFDNGDSVPSFAIRWTTEADWLGLETVRERVPVSN